MSSDIEKELRELHRDTVGYLQDLVTALKDSEEFLLEVAENVVGDNAVSTTLRDIADDRKQICEDLANSISLSGEVANEEGSFLGGLRTIWTTLRSGINSGDATVILIEVERAEDVILAQFRDLLPQIAGNPINDVLLGHFERIKKGHDRVRSLRDAYINA